MTTVVLFVPVLVSSVGLMSRSTTAFFDSSLSLFTDCHRRGDRFEPNRRHGFVGSQSRASTDGECLVS